MGSSRLGINRGRLFWRSNVRLQYRAWQQNVVSELVLQYMCIAMCGWTQQRLPGALPKR